MRVTRTFKRNLLSQKRIVVNRWWSSSWKTYSILQILFKWLISWEMRKWEFIMKWVVTVARQYRAEIPRSVLRDFYNILEEEWYYTSNRQSWWNIIKENKQEMTFSYQWRILEFIWCDDPEKVKWPRRKALYVNEANNVNYKVFMQMLMRTSWVCFIDFNPDDDEVWINTKLEQERAAKIWDVDVIVSTFRDNKYLERSIVDELLNLSILDKDEWNVYWNWEYWKIQWAIFEKWVHWKIIKWVPEKAKFLWYWQDFWFTWDPMTLIAIYIYWKRSIIVDEILYEENLVNTYVDESQKQQSIQWHYEMNNIDQSSKIWADSSEPKSIEELANAWYNIDWVKKWPGSVVSWIKFMKKYKIYITKNSLKTRNEFKKYVWATDKNWKVLRDKEKRPIPKDDFNHCIDAIRYWVTHLLWWQDMSNLSLTVG